MLEDFALTLLTHHLLSQKTANLLLMLLSQTNIDFIIKCEFTSGLQMY